MQPAFLCDISVPLSQEATGIHLCLFDHTHFHIHHIAVLVYKICPFFYLHFVVVVCLFYMSSYALFLFVVYIRAFTYMFGGFISFQTTHHGTMLYWSSSFKVAFMAHNSKIYPFQVLCHIK